MKKGFTLIELLAVIVILAIIAVITVPMISNVIEESKKQALEASVRGIVEATDYFAITNNGVYEFIFDGNNKGVTLKGESINYTGSVDAEGKLILDREGNISLCLMNEKYYAYKSYNSGIVIGDRSKDSCNVEYDSLTNKYIAFLESEGSVSNVYSKDEVDNLVSSINTSITTNTNEITNIKSNIETLQTSLNDYALKSELQETNENMNVLSSAINSNTESINNIKNLNKLVKIFDINSNSYGAGQTLGTSIDMSLYSGFVIDYSYFAHGYRKTSILIGDSWGGFNWLEMTFIDGINYCAGVQVRNSGLFIETLCPNPPYLVALYGIPANN